MIVFSWWLVFSKCELEEHWVHLKYAPTHRAHPFFQHGSFFQNTTECHSFIERVFRLLGSKYELCCPNTVRYLNLRSFTGWFGRNWIPTNKRLILFVFSQNLVVFSNVQKTSGLANGCLTIFVNQNQTVIAPSFLMKTLQIFVIITFLSSWEYF